MPPNIKIGVALEVPEIDTHCFDTDIITAVKSFVLEVPECCREEFVEMVHSILYLQFLN